MRTDRGRRVVRAEDDKLFARGLDLVAQVLGKDPEEEKRLLALDPSFDQRDTFLVMLDGEVISHLRLVGREMRIGRALLRVAVVADIVTAPAHQGRGNVLTALDTALEAARAARYHLALLFTDLGDFFAGEGWSGWSQASFAIAPESLELPPPADQVRAFRREDLGAVMAVHGHHGSPFAGPLARTIGWWKANLERCAPRGEAVVLEIDGMVAGYSRFRYDWPKKGQVAVVDLAAVDARGERILLTEVVRRAGMGGYLTVAGQGPLAGKLAGLSPELAGAAEVGIDERIMFKLINLRGLVRALVPEFEAICTRTEACRDGQVNLLVGRLAVELDVNQGQFDLTAPRSNKPSFLQLSEHDFWRLLFEGRVPPTAPEPDAAMLGRLFPEREFAFWRADEP